MKPLRRVRPAEVVDSLGGVASRDELLAALLDPADIDMSLYYGKILRVRRGWYASVNAPAAALKALRVGGRLACISALAWYDGEPVDGRREGREHAGSNLPRRAQSVVLTRCATSSISTSIAGSRKGRTCRSDSAGRISPNTSPCAFAACSQSAMFVT